MLARLAFLAALLFLSSTYVMAQNNTIIYMDYTSGYTTVLPFPGPVSSMVDTTYNTNVFTMYRFGVDWNGDATDQFTFTIPSTVKIYPENNASFCTPNATGVPSPNQITFLATGVHQCNYTVNWTAPFSAILTVTYDGSGSNIRSDAISTIFTTSSAVGDPQFIGLRGQSYQVHGIDGAVYNIISEKNTQVNSRFVFLSEGECPMIEGVPDTNCWSHPGSYMGELSFQQVVDGKLHAALVTAGDAKKGFASVQVDGKALKVGEKASFGSFSVEALTAHHLMVHTENFIFDLTNSDKFINQALTSKVALSKLHSHGLLGQTHSSKTYATAIKYIEGEVDDYAVADGDIFGDDFIHNRFQQ